MAIETTSDLSLVGTSQIVDGSVTSAKIGAGAVGSAAISAGSINSTHIGANAVVSGDIAAGAVGSAALATGAVVAAAISAGAVGTAAISSGAATSGQILQANGSGAVAFVTPAAGGGMTLIATATPSAATSLAFTSIPGDYKHLLLVWRGVWQSTSNVYWSIRLNNTSTVGIYSQSYVTLRTASIVGDGENSAQIGGASVGGEASPIGPTASDNTTSDEFGSGHFWLYRYTDTSNPKAWEFTNRGRSSTSRYQALVKGEFRGTSAITSIDFIRSSTQTINGTFYLYGVS